MSEHPAVEPLLRALRHELSGGEGRLLGAIGVARLDRALSVAAGSRASLARLRRLFLDLDEASAEARAAVIAEILEVGARVPVEAPAAPAPEVAAADPVEVSASESLRDAGLPEDAVAALAEAGVDSLGDLLGLPPEGRAEVFPVVHGAGRDLPAGRIAVGGRVRWRVTHCAPTGGTRPRLHLAGAGPLIAELATPVAAWDLARVAPGAKVVLVGQAGGDGVGLVDAEIVPCAAGAGARLAGYGVPGVSDAVVRCALRYALQAVNGLEDPLPDGLREREGLLSLPDALTAVHSGGDPAKARERLAFDEAWLLQLGIALRRFQGGRERGAPQAVLHGAAALIGASQGYELSDLEELAFDRIRRDLRSPVAMRRLLLTDGGSRQRFVARLAAAAVSEAKGQVVWACDASAVSRTVASLRDAMKPLGVVVLPVSDPRTAEGARRGDVSVVVGAPDALAQRLELRRLGLLVVDGLAGWMELQNNAWLSRAPRPDTLVMASEPFPVASLLGTFGDFEVSSCFDPEARGPRGQVWVSARDAAFAAARTAIDQGRQVVVVVPQSGGQDVIDQRQAAKLAGTLHDSVFRGLRIGLLHGEMPADEARAAWAAYDAHAVDVLVATTAVELGRSPSRPAVVLVEQADRVPPPRLVRLRGWAAPSGELHYLVDEEEPGWVSALASGASWAALQVRLEPHLRLDVREEEAEEAGVSWVTGLRWLRPGGELKLLLRARDAAHAALLEDPTLRGAAGGRAAKALVERWDDWFEGPCPLAAAAGSRRKRRRRRRR